MEYENYDGVNPNAANEKNPQVVVEGIRGAIMQQCILKDMENVESLKAKVV
jgi:hypothetical protein